jgi:hypothetical protein
MLNSYMNINLKEMTQLRSGHGLGRPALVSDSFNNTYAIEGWGF